MEDVANVDVSETEITPEMIEAGAAAFSEYDPMFDNSESMAIEIFRAMVKANPALLLRVDRQENRDTDA